MTTPPTSFLRDHLFWHFEQLRAIWRQSGVPYTDQLRLVKDPQTLGHWRVMVTRDADGVPEVTVPGFEDLGTTYDAIDRMATAVQAAAITRSGLLGHDGTTGARPDLRIVSDATGADK